LLLVSPAPEQPRAQLLWGGLDFVQYYAALELLFGGKNPYDQKLATARQMKYGRGQGVQMYAPAWPLLLLLVIGLPFWLAIYGYLLLNIALMTFCAACWTLLLFPKRFYFILFTLLGFSLWLPFQVVLYCGQNSLWPLAGLTG
jgi:hypothetical protein